MKNFLLYFSLILTVTAGNISGVIIDVNNGKPISNVDITIPKTKLGTVSNDLGEFEIFHNMNDKPKLVFSHIAYESYSLTINILETPLVIKLKESLLQMEDIVVTSMRSGYLLRDVPVATEVIGKKEILGSGAVTINELLNQRAGVSNSVNVDGGSIFNLLGLDSRYILILKDGQPITGRYNNRVDLSHISINRVQKIEITKGPGSALYGTDAMGGIINIITDKRNEENIFNLSYRGTSFGGTLNQIRKDPLNNILSSSIVLPLNKVTIYTDLTYQSFSKGQQFEYISADHIDKINTNTDISWSNKNKHSFFLNFQTYSQNEDGAARSAFGDILFNNSTKIRRSQASLRYNWRYSEKATLEQSLRVSNYSRNYLITEINNEVNTKNLTGEKDLEYEIMYTKIYPRFNLVYGMEFSQPEYSSDRIKGGNQSLNQNGAFIQTDVDIFNNIDFVTGLRVDRFQDTVVVSPRFAVSYKKNRNWKFRGAYGFGFRSPSFMESLRDWEHIQFGYRVIGNQNLKPESSKGVTLGSEYTNNQNFQFSILLYQNKFKNLIEDYSLEPGLLSYRNISIAKFSGIELTSKWAIGSKISISATYNYVENLNGKGEIIPNTIPHSFGSRISFSIFKNFILLSINNKLVGSYFPQEFDPELGDYKSSQKKVRPYIMSDLTVQYKLNHNYKIMVGLNNLSNHTNNTYGPYIGRVTYVEIQRTIKKEK